MPLPFPGVCPEPVLENYRLFLTRAFETTIARINTWFTTRRCVSSPAMPVLDCSQVVTPSHPAGRYEEPASCHSVPACAITLPTHTYGSSNF